MYKQHETRKPIAKREIVTTKQKEGIEKKKTK